MVPEYLDSETLLSVMRETEGHICFIVRNVGSSVYVRWNQEREAFEWLSVGGPARAILMYETISDENVEEFVGDREPPQIPEKPVRYSETPFPVVPAIADEYEPRSYSLDGGIQAKCDCGKDSIVYADEDSAEEWVLRHRVECDAPSHDLTEIPSIKSLN